MSNPNQEALSERLQPETLRLHTLTPALTVADLEASLRWYCDSVGFVVVQKWEEDGVIAGAIVEAGHIRLFLVQADEGSPPVSDQILQFYCATAQGIDDLATAIEARGCAIDKPPADQPWGARTFDLVDPDGVRLTISSIEEDRAT